MGLVIPMKGIYQYRLRVNKLTVLLFPILILVSGCGSQGMSDEQFDKLIYEQKVIAYKQCLVDNNESAQICRNLKP